MSAFHLSDVNIPHYVEKINSFNARAIEGYPSTLYILADYLNRHDIKLKLKAVFSSSETLYPNQREAIEQAFDCKLFDFYGTAERVVFGTECHVHNGKHLNFEYGYSEIVDDQDRLVANGTKGYLVGSSLLNKGMPLIRYKTTDITSISSDLCSCGRSMPIMENITTKAEDIIVTPEGKQVSPSVLTHPFKMINGINKSQIIQNSIDDILIKLVVESDFNVTEEKKLIESFVDRVGTSVNVRVEYVKDIPRERSGKYRWVISHVPKESLLLN
ncbi:MAG: phenylacetate--CoA ligase family protein [Cohaesibacteraceae bacterium]|nr:phenylacetate--CoA ligase family protein [Cohaesibacteraceae bacterium]